MLLTSLIGPYANRAQIIFGQNRKRVLKYTLAAGEQNRKHIEQYHESVEKWQENQGSLGLIF